MFPYVLNKDYKPFSNIMQEFLFKKWILYAYTYELPIFPQNWLKAFVLLSLSSFPAYKGSAEGKTPNKKECVSLKVSDYL